MLLFLIYSKLPLTWHPIIRDTFGKQKTYLTTPSIYNNLIEFKNKKIRNNPLQKDFYSLFMLL